jgi:hypothetical protein
MTRAPLAQVWNMKIIFNNANLHLMVCTCIETFFVSYNKYMFFEKPQSKI